MLYQWDVGHCDPDEVERSYWSIISKRPSTRIRTLASKLFRGTIERLDAIDPLITSQAEHWRFSRLATVERLILRLAVAEFLNVPRTPSKVVINEALELARTFSTEDAVRFVNGMLDGIRKTLGRDDVI